LNINGQFYAHQIRVSTEETDEKKAGKVLKHKLAEVGTGTHVDARNIILHGFACLLIR
jgi:hypothetical protein